MPSEAATSHEEDRQKIYEVSATPKQATKVWRGIIRKADHFSIQKLAPTSTQQSLKQDNIPAEESSILYPNPSSGMLHLSLEKDAIWQVLLCDLNGKQVKRTSFKGHHLVWDIRDLGTGTYFLTVQDEGGILKRTFRMLVK